MRTNSLHNILVSSNTYKSGFEILRELYRMVGKNEVLLAIHEIEEENYPKYSLEDFYWDEVTRNSQ